MRPNRECFSDRTTFAGSAVRTSAGELSGGEQSFCDIVTPPHVPLNIPEHQFYSPEYTAASTYKILVWYYFSNVKFRFFEFKVLAQVDNLRYTLQLSVGGMGRRDPGGKGDELIEVAGENRTFAVHARGFSHVCHIRMRFLRSVSAALRNLPTSAS